MFDDNDTIYYMDDFSWRLDIPKYEIDKDTMELLQCADMLQERKLSIRGAAREFGISKSRLHKFIHGELGNVCSELKALCKRQLRWNAENNNSFVGRYRK